jgi:hypothetical protein
MGVFDQINNALAGKKPAPSTGDGHTTSGMDRAMQAHADKLHPVAGAQQGNSKPQATHTRKDGSLILMGDSDYGT